jgi:tetratricopeptide (TPR) repeat protein
LHFKGEYGAAEGHLVCCLEIRERAGTDTLSVAEGLGGVYSAQGDYSKALEWFGQALIGYEESLGMDHPSTLTTVGNMALAYVNQGDYSKALEWHSRALVGRKSRLGETTQTHSLPSTYNKQGDKPTTQRAAPLFGHPHRDRTSKKITTLPTNNTQNRRIMTSEREIAITEAINAIQNG